MTGASPTSDQTAGGGMFWQMFKGPKADQWIAWSSIPVFYFLMGSIYFLYTHMLPPPEPTKTPAEIRTFLIENRAGIVYGNVAMMVVIGFLVWANGLIGWLISKMSIPHARVWGYAYMCSMCGGSLTGAYMASLFLPIAALRPDRHPDYTSVLYDLTYLSFDGTMGFFLFGSLIWCVAILLDKNRIFPKWFAFTCIWNFTTEFLVGTVMFVPSGPFAWNGLISFYVNVSVYAGWQTIYAVVLYKAVKRVGVSGVGEPSPLPEAQAPDQALATRSA